MDTKEAGRIGGTQTAKRGVNFYREIQLMSVKSRKKRLLSKFTVEDAKNPITARSIGEKLEQIELGQRS